MRHSRSRGSFCCMVIFGAGVFAALGVAIAYRRFAYRAADAQPHRQDSPSEFYLDVPGDYSPGRDWPVFVGVHGSGGTGLDCWRMWQAYADEGGFILVFLYLADPNSFSTQSANGQTLIAILNWVSREYAARPRVFLAVYSAGHGPRESQAGWAHGLSGVRPQEAS